jgi:hypothetical protein
MPVVTVHGASRRIGLAHVQGESLISEVRAGAIMSAEFAALQDPARHTMACPG